MLLWFLKTRLKELELYSTKYDPIQFQALDSILQAAKNTEFGKTYGFESISSSSSDLFALHKKLKENIPIHSYDDIKPYIERMRQGEENILWPGKTKWFSKSSGTTSDKSKYIPVSSEALENCHYKGGKDMFALYINNHPESNLFQGKNLAMGGCLRGGENDMFYGDVSAIIMQNLPIWAQLKRVPNIDIALMSEWESKIEKMSNAIIDEDVTSIAGVPSWVMVLLKKMLEKSGKTSILEVWPNIEVFFHGGVSFSPYKSQFIDLIGKADFNFVETYNASEGFFSMQDRSIDPNEEQDMLLMLDYGIFYEFVPIDNISPDGSSVIDGSKTLNVSEVEIGKNYAIIISTNAGLWRYMIGDTVVFTSTSPYRIRVSGRTKNFINAFGEEIIIDNADKALVYACKQSGAEINEYTAGPVFLDKDEHACHQWLIEFKHEPSDLNTFIDSLDQMLKEVNSDYEAKRYKDIMLKKPSLIVLPSGTFYNWMKANEKLGGQNKVPRLFNHRTYIDSILKFVSDQIAK